MRVLLLAAGLGTRLRPITDGLPKCLAPIRGRPLIDYWLDLVLEAGIERVLVNCHWLAHKVEAHIAASRWRSRVDLVQEPELLGTGGTVVANRAYFAGQPVMVAHADNLTDFDVAGMIAAHAGRPQHCAMTLLAFRTDDPQSCGILDLDGQHVVRGFHEKVAYPPGNLANAAVYILEPEVIDAAARLGKRFLDFSREVIPMFVGRILCVETRGYHRDIGSVDSLRKAQLEFTPTGVRSAGAAADRTSRRAHC